MSAQLDKLEFGGESPLTMRARCGAYRHCPDPLGIVTAEQLDNLEFAFRKTEGLRHIIFNKRSYYNVMDTTFFNLHAILNHLCYSFRF